MALPVRQLLLAFSAVLALTVVPTAARAGARIAFDGGTPHQRAQVTRALAASSFDWSILPRLVNVHISPDVPSEAAPGEVWLDARLLDSGPFGWGVVQHEFAHQVDFLLLTEAERAELWGALGGKTWCYEVPELSHAEYGCERFASTLAWAYWPNPENSMRPEGRYDESAAMAPAAFRALLKRMLGVDSTLRRSAGR